MTTPQAFEPICLIDSTQHAPASGLFLALTGYDLPQAAQLGGPLLQLTPCLLMNTVLNRPIGLHLGS
jgi:hypothetical protein